MEEKRTIPLITPEKLKEMMEYYKPVSKCCDDPIKYREIETYDPVRESFTWSKKFIDDAPELRMEFIKTVITHHNWGYYGFFKPSIKEVMAVLQSLPIPEETTYFLLKLDSSEGLLWSPDKYNISGYHRAIVTLLKPVTGLE